jgi:hypothetical protein
MRRQHNEIEDNILRSDRADVSVESSAVVTPEHKFGKIPVWGVDRLYGDDLKSVRSKDTTPKAIPVPTSERIPAKYDVALSHCSLDRDRL